MLRRVTTIFQCSANPLRRVLASGYLFLVPKDFRNSETSRPRLQLTIRHLWQMFLCPFHRPGVASSLAPPSTWEWTGQPSRIYCKCPACSSPKLLSRESLVQLFHHLPASPGDLNIWTTWWGGQSHLGTLRQDSGWGFVSHMVSVSVTDSAAVGAAAIDIAKEQPCANKALFTKSGMGADSVCSSRSIYAELFLNSHYNFKGAFTDTLVSHSPGRQVSQCCIHSFYIQGKLRSLVP